MFFRMIYYFFEILLFLYVFEIRFLMVLVIWFE
jgi:hypothetical protein